MHYRSLLRLALFCIFAIPAFSQTLTCNASSSPPLVRGEGLTERVGDIVLNCAGGAPNSTITGNLSVFLDVNITNRIASGNVVGIVFTIDNGSGPQPITTPGVLTSPGNLVYNGLSFNLSSTGAATLRIADIRGDVNLLMTTTNPSVQAYLSFNGGSLLSLTNSQLTVGTPVRSLYAGYSSKLVCAQSGSPLPSTINFSALLAAATEFATTRVTEGFADSLGPRSAWANLNADSGERIIVRYGGFTSGAAIFVPDIVAGSDAVQPTSGGDFGLPPSGGQYVYNGVNGSLLLARVSGADANGAGGTPVLIPGPGTSVTANTVTQVPLTNGSGYVVYEVVDANPSVQESAQFPTFLGLAPSGDGISVQTTEDVSLAPVSTIGTATATDPIPRFTYTSAPPDCSIVGDCGANYFPRLFVSPLALAYTATAGSAYQVNYFEINNQGGGVLNWSATIAYQNGSGWLTVTPSSGVNNATARVDVTPGNLAAGTYNATITVDGGPAAGTTTVAVSLVIMPAAPPPALLPSISDVVNAASFAVGPVAPGSLATIMGLRFAGNSVAVTLNGMSAEVLFANSTQINILVPVALGTQTSAQAIVTVDGVSSAPQTVILAPMAPAIFPGAVLNQDYSVNSAASPAAAGSIIQIFATGLSGPGAISARVAGRVITNLYYAGPAPGLDGVQQVDLALPADLASTTVDVAVCGNTGAQDVCSPAAKLSIQ